VNPVNLLADLQHFVHDDRLHGPLTADATEPAWNGYLVTVACSCGVVFERWVTLEGCGAGPGPVGVA
jgi:sarcosine oxidase delta subunit